MQPLYSNPPLADFILSEAPGQRSRDNVHVRQSGDAIQSGSLLVRDTAGTVDFAMFENATGNPTIATATANDKTTEGVYILEFTSATAFKVANPEGVQIGTGVAGTAFSQAGLGFTLTAGTTAAVAGDKATLEVVPADGMFVAYTGTGTASAVLYNQLHAKTGNSRAVAFTRDCEVKRSALLGLTAAAEDDLRAVGIVVRGTAAVLSLHTPAL